MNFKTTLCYRMRLNFKKEKEEACPSIIVTDPCFPCHQCISKMCMYSYQTQICEGACVGNKASNATKIMVHVAHKVWDNHTQKNSALECEGLKNLMVP